MFLQKAIKFGPTKTLSSSHHVKPTNVEIPFKYCADITLSFAGSGQEQFSGGGGTIISFDNANP